MYNANLLDFAPIEWLIKNFPQVCETNVVFGNSPRTLVQSLILRGKFNILEVIAKNQPTVFGLVSHGMTYLTFILTVSHELEREECHIG
ncbi:MAG TPA: hypothetical protein VHM20_07755 [Gammaproteobacteria bacterium]|nr:hypothetical protein [Gammaproteobacteria bacterium]